MPHATRSLPGAAVLVSVLGFVPILVGCGANITDDPVGGSPAALTQGASYLVSFTSGGIPANAEALVAAAGGGVVARYLGAGAVLARSTDAGFASSTIRPGIRRNRSVPCRSLCMRCARRSVWPTTVKDRGRWMKRPTLRSAASDRSCR